MSVFVGNPSYSSVNGYAELQGDMSVVNSTIVVTEGKILKIETGYAFCMIAYSITDLNKADSFKADTPICWIAHNKEYTRWTKDNPKLLVQPTDLETTVVEWLEANNNEWLQKSFKGKLHLNGAASVLLAVRNSKLWYIIAEFEECEPNLIKDLVASSGSKGRGGSSGQSEAQRIADRQAQLILVINNFSDGCTNLTEAAAVITQMQKETPEFYTNFMRLLGMTVNND